MQPALQVVFGRLLSVVEGGLAAQAGHGLALWVVGLPHKPLHHELGGRTGAVQHHALQLHLLRLQNGQVPLHLAELQAAVWKRKERDVSSKTTSHLPAPFPSIGDGYLPNTEERQHLQLAETFLKRGTQNILSS